MNAKRAAQILRKFRNGIYGKEFVEIADQITALDAIRVEAAKYGPEGKSGCSIYDQGIVNHKNCCGCGLMGLCTSLAAYNERFGDSL
jgi:hypothetical protein